MAILVTHASKHGATQQITERIAATLRGARLEVELKPIKEVGDFGNWAEIESWAASIAHELAPSAAR